MSKRVCECTCACISLCVTACPIYVHMFYMPVRARTCPWVSACLWPASAHVCQVCYVCAQVCQVEGAPVCAHISPCTLVCAACPCEPWVPCAHACACVPRVPACAGCALLPCESPQCPAVPETPVRVRVPERGAGERGGAGGGARWRGREAVPAPTDLQTFINSAAPAAAAPGLAQHRHRYRQRAGRGGAAPLRAHPARREGPGGGMGTVRG